MRKLATLGIILLLCGTTLAQRDFSQVEVKAQRVSGNIYMLVGSGGNIGVSLGEDGVVMVDDQYLPLAEKIEAALKGITDQPLRFVINTHWHGDHTGGNRHFGAEAPVLAHENVRKRLASGGQTRFGKVEPAPREALPIVTFNDSLSVHLNGEEIRAIHYPSGHTDGDSVIYFTGSNVVHMGDDFFVANFPFIDLDSGGSVQGLIAGVEKVLAETPDDVKIIPGHGPLSTKDDLREYLAMLQETSGAVKKAIAQGKTLEEIKAANLFAKYESWGKGFIKPDIYAEILYRSLSEKKKTGTNPQHPHGHISVGGAPQ